MTALSRRPLLVTALAISAMVLAACAAGPPAARVSYGPVPQAAPPPRDESEARRQLAYYTRQIARERSALGLSPDREHAAHKATSDASGAGLASSPAPVAPSSPMAYEPAGRPKARPARRAARVARSESVSKRSVSADDAGYQRGPTCPLPCRRTRAICQAARRICSLADYLADDDARQRCKQARQDCSEARGVTRDRCTTCPARPA